MNILICITQLWKGYILLPVILTHGLLAIEKFITFFKLAKCDISFKSVMLLFANVNVSSEVGK